MNNCFNTDTISFLLPMLINDSTRRLINHTERNVSRNQYYRHAYGDEWRCAVCTSANGNGHKHGDIHRWCLFSIRENKHALVLSSNEFYNLLPESNGELKGPTNADNPFYSTYSIFFFLSFLPHLHTSLPLTLPTPVAPLTLTLIYRINFSPLWPPLIHIYTTLISYYLIRELFG